jgi:hypothetical protein
MMQLNLGSPTHFRFLLIKPGKNFSFSFSSQMALYRVKLLEDRAFRSGMLRAAGLVHHAAQ